MPDKRQRRAVHPGLGCDAIGNEPEPSSVSKRRLAKALAAVLLLLSVTAIVGTGTAPSRHARCGPDYGSDDARYAIQQAMLDSDQHGVRRAIDQAKQLRGVNVGCANGRLPNRSKADPASPRLKTVVDRWEGVYLRALRGFVPGCPQLGRQHAAIGLAAYYAQLGGFVPPDIDLSRIASIFVAQQYSAATVSNPNPQDVGIYGFLYSPDSRCALKGVAGRGVATICGQFSQHCPRYSSGQFAGEYFAVRDHGVRDGRFIGDFGGAAYDNAWVGVMMIEAALQSTRTADRATFADSVQLVGDWAIRQPLVSNHNYTAKLVWLLAQLYDLTGNEAYRDAMLDRLQRNVLPGVLMDLNGDGLVDGMKPPVGFDELVPAASTPGRMWDGHNALPWYHSINAWAVVEAYAALRDRGDTSSASRLRPYMMAMIDNLALDTLNNGVFDDIGPAARDLPLALLLALWKVAQYEDEPQWLWEQAAWAHWNSGILKPYLKETAIDVSLYLLVRSETRYQPLAKRAAIERSLDLNDVVGRSIPPR